ncbi:MAG: SpoIIE family protein phosphatase [Treponema sp.]|jgi:sigma-B regulation protein RsbU (phosphoserine phosphatase)|nr:SpoIIE family protein phosphatase [Treponema sp.]
MYSIRAKILSVVLFFIAAIGAAFVIYSISTTVNYKRLRLEGIEKIVDFETEKVNKIIAEIERGSVFFAIGGMLCFKAQSEELGESLAVEYITSFPISVGGGFWFEPYAFRKDLSHASVYAYYDKAEEKVLLDVSSTANEYDYHNMVWYRDIVDNVTRPFQVVWTRPYVDDGGSFSLMTTAGSGIFDDDGKLIAISTVDWEIEEVIRELSAISPTKNSFVLLCVPEKDYILYSSHSKTGDSIKTIPWDINADSFTFDGVYYLRFGKVMDNGWLLSVQIPENEIFFEVERQNIRFSMIFALSSVIILLLAYVFVSKFINAPITQLTTDVSQLAIGNLDTSIKISSNDELGMLAQTFNKMTSDLKKSIEESAHERTEKERIGAELNVAAAIQASMLPRHFPPFPDRTEFDLYASMIPAKEVGGDFYDFYFIDRNNLVLVIADVSGKGIPSALFMVVARTLIKNCSFCKSPKEIFESINKKLCEGNDAGMFVTSFIGFYNIPSGRFVYVNAGHNPPLLKKKNASFEYIKTAPCLVLAFLKDTKYRQEEIYLESGDALYLYTDGVTEAMNGGKELFGEERLQTSLNKNMDSSAKDLLHAVKRDVDSFAAGADQADDITMLALKVREYSSSDSIKKLKLEAKVENLYVVMSLINAELEGLKYPSDLRNEISIAVEEIFINIANYAYAPETGSVTVSISTVDKTLIKFEDSGRPYNPLEQPEPDLKKPLIGREIGGLGVFLVKKIMDKVEYSRLDDKNILVITKEHPAPLG